MIVRRPRVRALEDLMAGAFCVALIDAVRHHSGFGERRNGLVADDPNTGFVCDEDRMRTAIQRSFSIATSNTTSRSCPSAVTFLVATTLPLTTSSTGTSRVWPMRARSTSQ